MAKLDRMQVEHVAKLAKIPVSSGELSKFGGQLGKIVEYVGQISKSKPQNPKQFQISKSKTKELRKDEIDGKQCLTQEEATTNAKNVHNGLFVAEAVFED